MPSSSRSACSVEHLSRHTVLALAGIALVIMLAGCQRETAQEAPHASSLRGEPAIRRALQSIAVIKLRSDSAFERSA